ncbi:MAG: hypothetical protein GXO29_01285 [Thermotogae bacterium]|nr:hypothetical protein [Thermotogota bacterium]
MKVLEERPLKWKLVETKTGAILHLIEVDEKHFFIEQNYKKPSKYGIAYKQLKERFPQFYMFWEIKNNHYTGKLLAGVFLTKREIDDFITSVLQSEEYKDHEDVRDEIPE